MVTFCFNIENILRYNLGTFNTKERKPNFKGEVIWSEAFEIRYNSKISDARKKFKVSLHQKNRNGEWAQIGGDHSINILTNLDSQNIIYRI